MKNIILSFIILVSCGILPLEAQLSINADALGGCTGSIVRLHISPAEALDTIVSAVWNPGTGAETVEGVDFSYIYEKAGSYNVSVLINGHYNLHMQDPLNIHPAPDANFAFSQDTSAGSYVIHFEAPPQTDNIDHYSWDFGDGSQSATPVTKHDFTREGSYPVKLSINTTQGCFSEVVKIVDVGDVLYVPNIFTPNGDGVNDYFEVRTDGESRYSLSIFSRSGVQVYHSETPTIVWDGRTQSGIKVHPGVYYYVIVQLDGNKQKEETGFVHLFR